MYTHKYISYIYVICYMLYISIHREGETISKTHIYLYVYCLGSLASIMYIWNLQYSTPVGPAIYIRSILFAPTPNVTASARDASAT